ncbi:hypothetical protein D9Q98_002217 [Chlorella vulgaris]|uniref:Thiamine pyrophosphokinase n=1 Tax=Chlorella vulgaris TaxID=3077 RepID=A0A9D4TWE9_CHLVU|nr:hypothetical protein D9Q98_002217 [Chlorella vulgaris]
MENRLLCSRFLSSHGISAQDHLAVVLLNWTLPQLTPRLWHTATLRVCADGGANRLYDELPGMLPGESAEAVRAQYLPTAIQGDLDSIRPDVVDFYRRHGVPVHDLSGDQDSTDLQKCIAYVRQHAKEQNLELRHLTLAALGALGGRLDHSLSSLSTLHTHRDLNLVLLGDGNLARLVPAGRCTIRPDRSLEGPSCGLVPCGGPAVATSSGLRWNLHDTEMRIGALVSTSNLIADDEVVVESDADLVWTTQLKVQHS